MAVLPAGSALPAGPPEVRAVTIQRTRDRDLRFETGCLIACVPAVVLLVLIVIELLSRM
jgi:hypothetical protein